MQLLGTLAMAPETTASQPVEPVRPPESGASLVLPYSVVGRVDAGRLLREMQALDEFLTQAAIREPGTPMSLPKTSRLLDETILDNKLNMLRDDERSRLLRFLTDVYNGAPTIHISFSSDPSPAFLLKLVTWLRRQIHPLVLLQVGLQPNMGAGCTVRTTNKYFDFSLRHRFLEKRDTLAEYLRGIVN